MNHKTKIVFSDVDNTLMVRGVGITDHFINAVKACTENGIEFVLCSGRPTLNLIDLANDLAKKGAHLNYVVGFNGAEIYDLKQEKIIFEKGLHLDDVILIDQILNKNEIEFLIYNEKNIQIRDVTNPYAILDAALVEFKIEKLVNLKATQKVLGLGNPEVLAMKWARLQEDLNNYTISLSSPHLLEITQKGVDKSYGLIKILEILNLNLDESVCFGDGGNDVEMLKLCPNSYAVGNAIEEAKIVCLEVLDTASNDGACKFIIGSLSNKEK